MTTAAITATTTATTATGDSRKSSMSSAGSGSSASAAAGHDSAVFHSAASPNTTHLDKYVNGLHKWRYPVAAVLLVAVGLGAVFGPPLMQHTSTQFGAPSGSRAYTDTLMLNKLFPDVATGATLIVYAKTTKSSVLGPGLQTVTQRLNETLATSPVYGPILRMFQGYYTLFKASPQMASTFVSRSGLASIITISLDTTALQHVSEDAAEFLQTTANQLAAQYDPSTTYTVEGIAAMVPTMVSSSEHDFELVDGIAMPIALLVFAMLVKSLRFLIIPVSAMITSALVSMSLMNQVALHLDVESFVPSLMMSILVAMNIDYSLFLLTRLREEIGAGEPMRVAVVTILRTAGRTVAVSGFTLCFCFLGLTMLPVIMMRTVGLGASLAILGCMAMAFVQTPLLLISFPNFFARGISGDGKQPLLPCCATKHLDPAATPLLKSPRISVGSATTVAPPVVDEPGFWPKLGRILVRKPWNIVLIVVVLAATMPADIRSFSFKTDDSMFDILPRDEAMTVGLKDMSEQFGYGLIEPYIIGIQPSDDLPVMSQTFFNRVVDVVFRLSQLPDTYPANFTSVAWIGAQNVSVPVALITICEGNSASFCSSINMLSSMFISADKQALWVQLTLPFDPLTIQGRSWLTGARALLDTASRDLHLHVYLGGVPPTSLDALAAVYDTFPIMIGVTAGVVLLFIGVSFRSIVIPLRAVATIALTISFVYGMGVYVYEDNIFAGLGWAGLQGRGSLQWLVPIMSFSLLVGIALDYDAFLLVRVHEAYLDGMSTPDAVVLGLSKTGHIITAAGAIMAIAFGGLLFSSVPVLNQLSFFLVMAVVFDTLVVRALLVPAIMGLLGPINWWPMKRPVVASKQPRVPAQFPGSVTP